MPDFDRYKFVEKCKRACEKNGFIALSCGSNLENTLDMEVEFMLTLLLKITIPYVKGQNEFYNTFKKYIGNDLKYRDNYISVQRARESEWQNICDYQRSKGKYELDKITLAINNIEEMYLFGKDVDHYK